MSDELHWGALAATVARFAGIQIPAAKRWYLEGRVRVRMQRIGVDSVARYVSLVRDDQGLEELGQLVEALRVGETRFFRHGAQVTALRRVVIPDIEARRIGSGQRQVRAWSAGCATGEEPYTVAMLLDEALPSSRGFRHEVLATDISEDALAVAQAGTFDALSVKTVPPEMRSRYFVAEGDEWRVTERLRAIVRFERRNLQDAVYPRGFDLILCRNVLIYFDRAGRERVIERLAESLLPGGYLFLGYSETLRGFESHFEVIRTEEGNLYRKQVPGGASGTTSSPPAEPRRDFLRGAARLTREPAPPARSQSHVFGLNAPSSRPRRTTQRGHDAPSHPPPSARPAPVLLDVVRVEGEYGDDSASALAALLQPALGGTAPVVAVDLEGAALLSDAAARVLARARRLLDADGRTLLFIARRPGVVRWVKRHGLDGGAPIAPDAAEAARFAAGRRP
jgi:chemotaxis protein methyltransferase CheR